VHCISFRMGLFLRHAILILPLLVGTDGSQADELDPEVTPDPKYAIKDLDGHFPFAVPETKEAWEQRAEELRMQLLVSQGLFPKPTMAAMQPTLHSKREFDGYTIEKVYFESLPGLFVTGSLFTPLEKSATVAEERRPAVLCPHGHWNNGRFYYTSEDEMRRELATGAERFESAAHSPLQARCVQMARMGIIVFHYDMLGYADSQQISMQRAHGFGLHGENPPIDSGRWLLFSPTAEGWLQNAMGLQTINTLQSLEFLLQRPDVDPARISITGASGGGTQTFIASAIEPRFAGAYPVVMVSTSMQGGCTCENAAGLRVATGNVEIAALTAPRPMGMNAANDWTRDMAKDGFPELKKLYGLYGAQDRVSLQSATHFPHNYNHVTRVAMYGFMNRLFGLGFSEPILERDFEVLSASDLQVWDSDHPAPPSGIEFEADLLQRWAEDVAAKVAASTDVRRRGWETLLRPAERVATSLTLGEPSHEGSIEKIDIRNAEGKPVGSWLQNHSSADLPFRGTIQVASLSSHAVPEAGKAILLLDDAWGIDSLTSEQSLVKNPRPAACYTYGYNPPLFLRRLAVFLAFVDSPVGESLRGCEWQGEGALAAIVAAAAVLRPDRVERMAGDANGFDFSKVESIRDENFLPGALRFGGFAGLRATAIDREP
jgi:hypothetical protein